MTVFEAGRNLSVHIMVDFLSSPKARNPLRVWHPTSIPSLIVAIRINRAALAHLDIKMSMLHCLHPVACASVFPVAVNAGSHTLVDPGVQRSMVDLVCAMPAKVSVVVDSASCFFTGLAVPSRN